MRQGNVATACYPPEELGLSGTIDGAGISESRWRRAATSISRCRSHSRVSRRRLSASQCPVYPGSYGRSLVVVLSMGASVARVTPDFPGSFHWTPPWRICEELAAAGMRRRAVAAGCGGRIREKLAGVSGNVGPQSGLLNHGGTPRRFPNPALGGGPPRSKPRAGYAFRLGRKTGHEWFSLRE